MNSQTIVFDSIQSMISTYRISETMTTTFDEHCKELNYWEKKIIILLIHITIIIIIYHLNLKWIDSGIQNNIIFQIKSILGQWFCNTIKLLLYNIHWW